MSSRRRASAFDIRETLDDAVRRLSVNASPIQERVRVSGMIILDRLSPADFACAEDCELFNEIHQAFADSSFQNDGDGASAVMDRMPDASAEAIASDIVDLRDTMMGRAIRNARIATHARARGRSRG